ncbi:MAG: ASCH domain-containing protein [Coriobacteriia bacterium]
MVETTRSGGAADTVVRMWADFASSGLPYSESAANGAAYTSWHFGTGGEMADELVELVLAGTKRATAGALWSYEQEGELTPEIGDFSIVTDGSGVARCIIRTTRVAIVPFDEVDEDFAATEGEGDGSLEYWREGHWRYFSAELAQAGLTATRDMPVVCERFQVVYPAGVAGAAD